MLLAALGGVALFQNCLRLRSEFGFEGAGHERQRARREMDDWFPHKKGASAFVTG
jgi:hypothetical protein